ncbi:hypothetical protein UVI_02036560 [Ustilaginoidea virens]|uniref:DASH complex subunit ASK1 n=1 Tax=Ustilaginoidea virens TaxID=1159556 RepID=A0A1B5L3S9_USTVR|nr:hypothetical protein UVI_02036560 [Ustilaginoidea virens]
MKFWKQFFEASANVSLSGYEELANDDDSTMMEESTAIRDETLTADDSPSQAKLMSSPVGRDATIHMDDSLLDDAELSGSTPRLPRTKTISADTFSSSMRLEAKGQEGDETTVLQDEQDSTVLFAQRTARLPDMSLTPSGLREHTAAQQQSGGRKKDPLLHRILDKTYRVRTTPHRPGSRASPLKRERDDDGEETKAKAPWHDDDSLLSSPEMAPPTLRSEVFMSPYKLLSRQRAAATAARGGQGPRTPGVSVQTPATGKKSRNALDPATAGRGRAPSGAGTGAAATGTETGNRASRGGPRYEIDWESGGDDDDDDDDADLYAGMSPPKTIQFALPPSKLLQTPG